MPLPPVHGLVALLPYFKAKSVFDPLALVASATFVDLEPLIYIFMGQQLNHQIWHGYALALTVYPVIVGLIVYSAEHLLENRLWSAYEKNRIQADSCQVSAAKHLPLLLGGQFQPRVL